MIISNYSRLSLLTNLPTEMYTVGAHIISHVTRTPFQSYISRNIISPLGLNSTTYNFSEAERYGKLADGFVDIRGVEAWNWDGKIIFKPIPIWNLNVGDDLSAGPGGVITNVKDLACLLISLAFGITTNLKTLQATWLQALLLSGKSPETNHTVIPAAVVEKVTGGVTIAASRGPEPELSPYVYGMGQERYTYQGHEVCG